MQFLPLLIVLVFFLTVAYALYARTKKNKEFKELQKQAVTFEDKMLLLKSQSNQTLKSIDYTLDWFFWLMILGGVIYVISLVFAYSQQQFL